MADKSINLLTVITTPAASDDAKLLFIGLPGNGLLYQMTVAQAKAIYATQKVNYVASGSEGSSLTISALSAMLILSIVREGAWLHEASATPDPAEYSFNGSAITFGAPMNAGERLTILYKYA